MGACAERATYYEDGSVRDLRARMVVEYLKQREVTKDKKNSDSENSESEKASNSSDFDEVYTRATVKSDKLKLQSEFVEDPMFEEIEIQHDLKFKPTKTVEKYRGKPMDIETSPVLFNKKINTQSDLKFKSVKPMEISQQKQGEKSLDIDISPGLSNNNPRFSMEPRPSLEIQKLPNEAYYPLNKEEKPAKQVKGFRQPFKVETTPIFEPIRPSISQPIDVTYKTIENEQEIIKDNHDVKLYFSFQNPKNIPNFYDQELEPWQSIITEVTPGNNNLVINYKEDRDFSPLPSDRRPKFKKSKPICVDDLFTFKEDAVVPKLPKIPYKNPFETIKSLDSSDIKLQSEFIRSAESSDIKSPFMAVKNPYETFKSVDSSDNGEFVMKRSPFSTQKQEADVFNTPEQIIEFEFSPDIIPRESTEDVSSSPFAGGVFVKSRKVVHMFRDYSKPLSPEMYKLNLDCRLTIDEEQRKSLIEDN